MKSFFTIFTALLVLNLNAQTISDFENFGLNSGEFLNGSNGEESFESGNVNFPNNYFPDPMFPHWNGWSISATNDTQTPGSANQYSSISGSGFDGSSTYGVSFAGSGSQMKLTGDGAGGVVNGFYINNGTYPYLSMLEGDMFAKKFGGEDGNDPDYFLLTIKAYFGGQLSTDSVDFYLADYRFEDNSMDYIVTEWTWVDLTDLGNVDSLQFTLTSTDIAPWGMNTPAYFCVDNVTTSDEPNSTKNLIKDYQFQVFPNPTADILNINWQESIDAFFSIYNLNGQKILEKEMKIGNNQMEIGNFSNGNYLIKIQTKEGVAVERFVKI